jgi:uncharacterized surface protein with fasciclin (FAS1) repeats
LPAIGYAADANTDHPASRLIDPVFAIRRHQRSVVSASSNQNLMEMPMNFVRRIILAAAFALPFSAAQANAKDIVDTAVSAGQFNTLVAAVKAAGLVDTLKGAGPFTVFAPTDEAFKKLPAGTVENLLKPENKDQLVAVLTYHVVPGKVMAKDIAGKSMPVKTVQGSSLAVNAMRGVKVDEANVVQADIEASNGVIHVIDSVVLPK